VSDAVSLPDALLAPLVESAGDTLRALDATDVPAALRHLQSFDRRGFMHGPAPRQIMKSLTRDDAFRVSVVSRFRERQEVRALLDAWDPARALEVVDEADARGDLALLASALWAVEPRGHAYGLGVVHARYERRQQEKEALTGAQADARAREEHEEARRRSDAARMTAQAELERVEQELREERRARRLRETQASAEAASARRTAEGVAAQLEQAHAAVSAAQARATREARRAQELEQDVRALRAEVDELRGGSAQPAAQARALERAADLARKLSTTIDELARGAQAAPPAKRSRTRAPKQAGDSPRAPSRRTAPDLPGGVVADSVPGVDAMLRTQGVALIVDGYNVAKRAWPDATPGDMRERLALALAALHARTGCSSTIVFDGDQTGGASVPVLRRRGLRVLFSAPGEEADDVVVREVARQPKRVPVVVASSDMWVREHAEKEGAVVVGADTLLAVTR
jgi:predicted RNA-binding protein with PIN domain